MYLNIHDLPIQITALKTELFSVVIQLKNIKVNWIYQWREFEGIDI